MSSTRANRRGSLLLAVMAAGALAAAPRAWAQGYGPDPFRPYNAQYDAYTYPIGPGGPNGANGGLPFRSGLRGANQYENYLSELAGADRSRVEKYGIGMPYYRSAIDPRFLTPDRDYMPNRKSNRSFEQTQTRITEKYMAYFEERDPKKRAQLFKEYAQAQSSARRLLSAGRRGSASRVLDAADEVVTPRRRASAPSEPDVQPAPTRGSRRGAAAIEPADEPLEPRRSSTRGSAATVIPPAPAPPGGAASSRSRRTASDVLNRARGLRDPDATDLAPPAIQPRPLRRPRSSTNAAGADGSARRPGSAMNPNDQ
jgi:hypothetical protein